MSQKIVFMGTPEFSVPTLESLVNSNHKILAVYSQPASKANRGQKIIPSRVEVFAKEYSLDLRTPDILDSDEEYDYLKKLEPDIVVVIAYGKIIPKKFLNLPKHGFINAHASLLPKWRGAAPIQRAIMNLDKETGVSIMKIEEKLDTGPVCNNYKLNIDNNLNSLEISEKLSFIAAEKILDNIDDILEDNAIFKDQDHSKATYAIKIQKSEGLIEWTDNAKNIVGKINGLFPVPGAFFILNGQRYKILKAEISSGIGKPGEVLIVYL